MSMIVDVAKKHIEVSIPNSESIIDSQVKGIKDSEVTGYYTNDKKEKKEEIAEFLKRDYEYILNVSSTIDMLNSIKDNIYNEYSKFFKNSMKELESSLNYFLNLRAEKISIPKMFYSGDNARYLKFDNENHIIKKLRSILYGDITGFYIVNKNNEYEIKPFLKGDWRSVLEKKREKIEMLNKDIKEKFVAFHESYRQGYESLSYDEKAIDEFIKEYPLERIKTLSLNDYALGTDDFKNSLSYKLEFGEYKDLCASVRGGPSNKYGIYLSNQNGKQVWKAGNETIGDPNSYWEDLRSQIYNALNDSVKGNIYEYSSKYPLLKGMSQIILKLAFIYDEKKSYVGILGKQYLVDLCKIFNIFDKEAKKLSSEELNNKLTKYLYKEFDFIQGSERDYISSLLWEFMKYINGKKEETNESNKYIYPDLFMSDEYINKILDVLKRKNNIILQGPPGVGKTFVATNLLDNDDSFEDVDIVQFHQSYSYEDFVQGFRPTEEGTFVLKNGNFYNCVMKALGSPDKNYCIIIDEINRGNLSKIFGELMMLIEADKRKQKYELSLTYSQNGEKFYIPSNLYIVGTMNTADRSLAMVDYALRRRFAFIDLYPAFDSEKFKDYMLESLVDEKFLEELCIRLIKLNKMIFNSLGKGFEIGHSYFVGTLNLDNLVESYNEIIEYEIKPLLEEYWFDDEEKIKEALYILEM